MSHHGWNEDVLMDDPIDDGCDHEDIDCPICAGRMSPEFVERIMAVADQPGPSMTGEEFKAWLDRR